ncbi:hypothetical protein H9Q74_010684 [Fusarium xylarioides]|nr:hypothetical protein H9Q71_010019 [Fusarium xylarioides]KAG5817208.1 hypothetical protein H9Q74_010684 [Fusarium xylarioides]
MYDGQEEHDILVWDKNDEDFEAAQQQMRLKAFCRKVEGFVQQKFGRPATLISPLIIGGFNTLYRVRVEDMSPDVMVRLPCPSLVQFPAEKTIPLFFGKDPELGPFIIMEHWENSGSISGRLTMSNKDPSVPYVLNPDTPEPILEGIWTKVAHCLLELSQLTFPRIGSLLQAVKDTYEVAGRPVTLNMTEMIRLANIPRCILPSQDKTYMTADEWYTVLAEMHIAQLVFQHNDLVTSEDDCRNKYVSQTLSPCPSNSGPFRLWGDDFRAGNILLDASDQIAALIDWEYTYAGPTQFILDPPWWLLLETAEMWSPDLEDWRQTYESRLGIWLSAMEKAEASIDTPAYNTFPVPLSRYMRESWQTGRFFLSYAARKSWAFDAMYWNFLDERFFGDRDPGVVKGDLWKTRIDLLSDDERAAMEPFVQRKMAEGKERRVVEWDETEAQKRFSELLFN